ncbi:RRQRL motif-containing zinc-binding protein [Streptomyces sp. NPDC059639]|uniref:RRQRL motif-containing zinc-binding protein n=1 Tax=Streptomyces sp. NPDC059639 TaxID=3346891 RepID=UPI0036CE706D
MSSLTYAKCLDPSGGQFGIPTYPWRYAPEGLATRRQLRVQELRPGGQPVAAQVLRPRYRRGPLVAYLYRIDRALPVRPMTPGKRAALAKAMCARRTCPVCRKDAGYVIPGSLGMCVPCAFPRNSTPPERRGSL